MKYAISIIIFGLCGLFAGCLPVPVADTFSHYSVYSDKPMDASVNGGEFKKIPAGKFVEIGINSRSRLDFINVLSDDGVKKHFDLDWGGFNNNYGGVHYMGFNPSGSGGAVYFAIIDNRLYIYPLKPGTIQPNPVFDAKNIQEQPPGFPLTAKP
jgi:hypothetical protein